MVKLWHDFFEVGEMYGFLRLMGFIAAYVLIFGLAFAVLTQP